MNDKKILFFDIDGTLLTPHPFKVPESTSRALTKAHENGHLLFINTGTPQSSDDMGSTSASIAPGCPQLLCRMDECN